MKTILLTGLLFCLCLTSSAQNISDNNVSFAYIQLPLIKIDDAYHTYDVQVVHSYKSANDDSLLLFNARKDAAQQQFERERIRYQQKRDSLERLYLRQLSAWEINVNAGQLTASGQPLPQPNPPIFPEPPMYPVVKQPRLHADFSDDMIRQMMQIQGFTPGTGGTVLTINLLPLRNIHITERKKGSGSSTKYEYTCEYILPVEVKIESPSQGIVLVQTLFDGKKTYGMSDQKSRYDHQLFMLDQGDRFYDDLERYARQLALKEANDFVNDQIGYVTRTRSTEIYSVKNFKNYDYSDVTNAYSATVQALNLLNNDRDRSGAQEKLTAAMKMWEEIMMESNTYDNKARINDKISAMIQCNMAEIQLWQSKFSEANAMLNLIINSGVLKGKTHAKRMESFYEECTKRWNVHH